MRRFLSSPCFHPEGPSAAYFPSQLGSSWPADWKPFLHCASVSSFPACCRADKTGLGPTPAHSCVRSSHQGCPMPGRQRAGHNGHGSFPSPAARSLGDPFQLHCSQTSASPLNSLLLRSEESSLGAASCQKCQVPCDRHCKMSSYPLPPSALGTGFIWSWAAATWSEDSYLPAPLAMRCVAGASRAPGHPGKRHQSHFLGFKDSSLKHEVINTQLCLSQAPRKIC